MSPGTTLEVAHAIGWQRHPAYVESLLREEEKNGHVERVDGGWALTASAEQRFGRVLRELSPLIPERNG